MSQCNARQAASQSRSRPENRRDWQTWGENKRRKKRIVAGEETEASQRSRNKPRAGKPKSATASERPLLQSLVESFSGVVDPRIDRQRRHLLIDIIVIGILATLCNADGWKEIQIWGEAQQAWLRTFLELPNGIPSRDTLRRTISRLDPAQFQQAFLNWLGGVRKEIQGVIAIDGKTLRRSGDGEKKPLHIVSAWASEQHLTLGQVAVAEKSNEITAIPQLLALLTLKGAIVTIDAMGCQKQIAAMIVAGHGDFCLAVKDNQPTLAEDITQSFEAAFESEFAGLDHDEFQTAGKAHGREESRYYYTLPAPESLRTADQWPGLQSIGMAVTRRGPDCVGETRYYINSFASDAKKFADAVRSHWGIENSLHWVMDVTFREDDCRIRKHHGAENVSWLRRLAISLIKLDTTRKDSIRGKRIRAGYDVEFLKQMLASIAEKI